jgi:hypothetical protein
VINDHRSDQRFSIERNVRIKLPSGRIVRGVTRDLSFGGSFIECDVTYLHSGDECYLSVALENDDVSAEIFSLIQYSNKHGIGCHFLTFDSGYYQFLTNYSLQSNHS